MTEAELDSVSGEDQSDGRGTDNRDSDYQLVREREEEQGETALSYEESTSPDQTSLAVSIDIEDWYHVPAVTGSSFSEYTDTEEFFEDWDEKYDYLTKPTYRTLDLLDDLGITATFFVVADVVDNYPGLVETIADRGHEIGCHGLHHECTIDPDTKEPRFTKEEYAERLRTAKAILEEASGQEVIGYRAPGAYVGGWVLDVLEDVGFEYDSSVARNSLYNKTDQALDDVETSPYTPENGSLDRGGNRDFVELPWPYYDAKIGKVPAAGGPLLRLFGRRVVQAGIEQSLSRGDSVFYFHPVDISRESFPKAGNMKRRPMYWMFKGERTEKRIRTLLHSFENDRLTTCDELASRYKRK